MHVRKEKPILRMINKYNIAELSLVDRPIKTTKQGFGAVIPHHDDTHGARYFNTEHNDNFGERPHPDARETANNFDKQ